MITIIVSKFIVACHFRGCRARRGKFTVSREVEPVMQSDIILRFTITTNTNTHYHYYHYHC